MSFARSKEIKSNKKCGLIYVPLDAKDIPITSGDSLSQITLMYTDHLADCVGISLIHRDQGGKVDKLMLFHSNSAHVYEGKEDVQAVMQKKSFYEAKNDHERFIMAVSKFLNDYDGLQDITVILHKTAPFSDYNSDESHIRDLLRCVIQTKNPKISDEDKNLALNVINQVGTPLFYVDTSGASASVGDLPGKEKFAKLMVEGVVALLDKGTEELHAVRNVKMLRDIIGRAYQPKNEVEYPFIRACNEIDKCLSLPEIPKKPSAQRSNLFQAGDYTTESYQKFVKVCRPIIKTLEYASVIGCDIEKAKALRP